MPLSTCPWDWTAQQHCRFTTFFQVPLMPDPATAPTFLPACSRHRAYSFLLHNGIDSLYKGYAASLDLLVLAAWDSVEKLKTGARA